MNLKPVQQLLDTEMDRKEFLAYIGASILAIIGVSSIAKNLLPTAKQDNSRPTNKAGYGDTPYGG